MREFNYRITEQQAGLPLGKFLEQQGYSQKLLAALKRGGLTVNGGFHRLIDSLAAGDLVCVKCEKDEQRLVANAALKVPIAYEDEDFIVYNKPSDMLVHPAGRGFDDALGNCFAAAFAGQTFRPLGRLDRHTTGLCLIAKHSLAATLGAPLARKSYLAIAAGQFAQQVGSIDAPLLRVAGAQIKRVVDSAGQRALTHYRVVRQFEQYTLLELWLETGRTHQIRAHLAHLGHPLLGDSLYGGCTELIGRQALHCATLDFCQPFTQQEIAVTAALPADMAKLLR